MKPTRAQIVFAYAASISLMLAIFHRQVGLADYWEWIFYVVCFVAWSSFFVSRRRQKAALTGAGTPPAAPPPPNKKIFWLSLGVLAVASLSSFMWLPYTGTTLPRVQLIIISIVSCISCITIYCIAWRRSHGA